jgi:hypothetical protein
MARVRGPGMGKEVGEQGEVSLKRKVSFSWERKEEGDTNRCLNGRSSYATAPLNLLRLVEAVSRRGERGGWEEGGGRG